MRISQIILSYKCGCEWVRQYVIGASKWETKNEQERAKRRVCPKCTGADAGKSAGEYADMPTLKGGA